MRDSTAGEEGGLRPDRSRRAHHPPLPHPGPRRRWLVKYVYSDVPEVLDVREELFVRGRLRSGATIRAGQLLLVDGTAEGSISVEDGGVLVMSGLLSAFIDGNDGVIAVSGAVSTPLEMVPGRLLLTEGSFATIDGDFRVVTRLGFEASLETTLTDQDLRTRTVLELSRPSMRLEVTTHDAFARLSEAMAR
jgi:hypothetical protein